MEINDIMCTSMILTDLCFTKQKQKKYIYIYIFLQKLLTVF